MFFDFTISVNTIITLLALVIAFISIREQIKSSLGTKEDVFKARRVEQLKIAFEIEKHISETSLMALDFFNKIADNKEVKENDLEYYYALIERYLQAIDTLCFAINKGYLDNVGDWKHKYNDTISENIKAYTMHYGVGTPYKNTVNIYKKWNDAQ